MRLSLKERKLIFLATFSLSSSSLLKFPVTAESLTFWLMKLVKEQSLILCNSKFTSCVILKEPPFVVSVAVLIINIYKYKSRAVTLYLIKHRILIRGGFIDIKSLHVMYDRLFDRSMGF